MKKSFYLLSAAAILSFTSCGGDDKSKNGETTDGKPAVDMDMTGMMEEDLSDKGLNVKIMVAEETGSTGNKLPVVDSVVIEGLQWQVMVGDKYNIVIEEADGSGDYIKKEKDKLNNLGIWDLKYEVDEPNVMLYEASLKNGAGQKPFYHVYGIAKIDGKDFIIRSYEQGEFHKGNAEKMLKTIRALQQKAS